MHYQNILDKTEEMETEHENSETDIVENVQLVELFDDADIQRAFEEEEEEFSQSFLQISLENTSDLKVQY